MKYHFSWKKKPIFNICSISAGPAWTVAKFLYGAEVGRAARCTGDAASKGLDVRERGPAATPEGQADGTRVRAATCREVHVPAAQCLRLATGHRPAGLQPGRRASLHGRVTSPGARRRAARARTGVASRPRRARCASAGTVEEGCAARTGQYAPGRHPDVAVLGSLPSGNFSFPRWSYRLLEYITEPQHKEARDQASTVPGRTFCKQTAR